MKAILLSLCILLLHGCAKVSLVKLCSDLLWSESFGFLPLFLIAVFGLVWFKRVRG